MSVVRLFLQLLAATAVSHSFLLRCSPQQLVVYKLEIHTFWTKELFPKQYPEWRPPAHWSRTIGVSHSEEYTLFREGEKASVEFKHFAETGKANFFETHNEVGIQDEFYAPRVSTGAGTTEVSFFADGNHSLVSVATRLVPSPDWFIGVDSLDLCGEGHWTDSIVIEASPMDAGTDSGFTFTSPNWVSDPPEDIYKITSKFPKHPANSFFNPALNDLPSIATFNFTKERVYNLEQPETSSAASTTPLQDEMVTTTTATHVRLKKRRGMMEAKCKLTEWSEWSECTASCGTGTTYRIRRIKGHKAKAASCPPLRQERVCEAVKDCSESLFKW